MSEDNRTYNNRTGKNTGNNRRYSGSTGGANRPDVRTTGRNGRGRSLNDYSVDVAAQRGVVRDDSALRRNKRPGDVKVASVGRSSRSDLNENRPARRERSADEQVRRSRNVDVADARRQSGKVDVETGRRLDGRVRVPVDKRRVQPSQPSRSKSSQPSSGKSSRMQEDRSRSQNGRRRPDEEQRRTQDRHRRPDEEQRRAQSGRRRQNEEQRRTQDRRRRSDEEQIRTQDRRRCQDEEQRRSQNGRRRPDEEQRRAQSGRRRPEEDDRRRAQDGHGRYEDDQRRSGDNARKAENRRNKKKVKAKKVRTKKVKRKPTPQEIERKQRLKQERLERRKQRREKAAKVFLIVLKVLLVLIVIAVIAATIINSCYKLKKINVSGTDHYTDQQMEDIVSGGKKYSNTLLFILNNKMNPPGDVTFIDKIDVSYVYRNTVSITVYEKAMAGCIEYNGKYAYFDGDGIVLEISDKKLDDVPCIEGLTSDNVEQGKKLSVGDNSFFQEILTMTQLIYKNDIQIDKITYDNKQNLILHKDGIKIKIGNADNLESKFMNLENILSTLKGKKGTLDMSTYSASDGNVIFKENK